MDIYGSNGIDTQRKHGYSDEMKSRQSQRWIYNDQIKLIQKQEPVTLNKMNL